MFGLGSQKRNFAQTVTPRIGLDRNGMLTSVVIPEGMVLVTRQDIYSDSEPAILLLKAGQVVNEAVLEKLIRHGTHPDQLALRKRGSATETVPEKPELSPTMSAPRSSSIQRQMALSPEIPVERALQHKVLLFDSDDKGAKRLTHCLIASGVRLADIHCVRLAEHISWAVQKYQPRTVFLSCRLADLEGATRFNLQETVNTLKSFDSIQSIVLVGDVEPSDSEDRQLVEDWADTLGCQLIFKPLSRFVVDPCLKKTDFLVTKK